MLQDPYGQRKAHFMVIRFRPSDEGLYRDLTKRCRAGSYGTQVSSCSNLACGSRMATTEELMFVSFGTLMVF